MKTYLLRNPEKKVLGDKTELHYTLEPGKDRIAEIEVEIKTWLSQNNKTAKSILEGESGAPEELDIIRMHLGLTAGKDQQDLYGFIESILKRLS